jgi:aryl-alcohol dehydrogenase-like predicted oxidoreductase
MKYKFLSNTGVLVSELCLGTMSFGGKGFWEVVGRQGPDEAYELVRTAYEQGLNFVDTADAYSEGESELLLGKALRQLGVSRQEWVVATKVRLRTGRGVNQVGLSRLHLMHAVDDSLRRLDTDYIDLYYVHGVDAYTPLEETMRGLEDIVRSGKVRYLGVSNLPAWQIMKANGIARQRDWTPFVALQHYYSLASRDVEREILPMSEAEGLAFMPWSPLAGGFLTGKFTQEGRNANGARREGFDFPPLNKEKAYQLVDVLQQIGHGYDASVAQVALAWLLSRKAVTSVVIGAIRKEQLLENLASVDLKLEAGDLKRLDELSALAPEYPAWMFSFQSQDRSPALRLPVAEQV